MSPSNPACLPQPLFRLYRRVLLSLSRIRSYFYADAIRIDVCQTFRRMHPPLKSRECAPLYRSGNHIDLFVLFLCRRVDQLKSLVNPLPFSKRETLHVFQTCDGGKRRRGESRCYFDSRQLKSLKRPDLCLFPTRPRLHRIVNTSHLCCVHLCLYHLFHLSHHLSGCGEF